MVKRELKRGIKMGDRASVSFRNGKEESVVLCSHWGGREFQQCAINYAKELKVERGNSTINPIDRLEPSIVMVDFIRYMTTGTKRVLSDLYLGKDTSEVDNSDNGHYTIDLADIEKSQKIQGEFEGERERGAEFEPI